MAVDIPHLAMEVVLLAIIFIPTVRLNTSGLPLAFSTCRETHADLGRPVSIIVVMWVYSPCLLEHQRPLPIGYYISFSLDPKPPSVIAPDMQIGVLILASGCKGCQLRAMHI